MAMLGGPLMRTAALLMLGARALSVSCASTQIKRVSPGGDEEGIRFYKPVPYLLVTAAQTREEGSASGINYTAKVVWLPDYSDVYAIKPIGRLGSADLTVTLQDG